MANRARRPAAGRLQVASLHKALDQKERAGPISTPEEVIFECLTALRRPDLQSLAPYLPPGTNAWQPEVRIAVGSEVVVEAGPLACCHAFMDTAARRVLPGHLLRRCQVLSSIHLGSVCQQRVALTACTGEEAVFVWRMRRTMSLSMEEEEEELPGDDAAPGTSTSSSMGVSTHASAGSRAERADAPASASSAGSSSGRDTVVTAEEAAHKLHHQLHSDGTSSSSSSSSFGSGGDSSSPRTHGVDGAPAGGGVVGVGVPAHRPAGGGDVAVAPMWVVESVARDASQDEEALPPQPHPRCSPEVVVKAQLAALRQGDLVGAAAYNLWSRSTSGGWDVHLQALKAALCQPSHAPLLQHAWAELGASALASQRQMLQEVRLGGGGAAAGAAGGGRSGGKSVEAGREVVYVFQLGMQANGCWMVEAIRACPAAA